MTQTRRTHLKSLRSMLAAPFMSLAAGPDFSSYTDKAKEKFLLTGRIVSVEEIGHGVTKPLKVTLELDGITHAAKIQSIDKVLPDFFAEDGTRVPMKDSWRFNIAAYKVDRLLQLNMVTVEVPRLYKGKPAAFSWWVDDVMFEEVERIEKDLTPPDPKDFERQRAVSRVFDELIINIDRNLSNLLITKRWKLALMDHSRSFTPYHGIRNKRNLTQCSRNLLEMMKKLTPASVSRAVETHLTPPERQALIARRDRIVDFFEQRAKEQGEENVLFS